MNEYIPFCQFICLFDDLSGVDQFGYDRSRNAFNTKRHRESRITVSIQVSIQKRDKCINDDTIHEEVREGFKKAMTIASKDSDYWIRSTTAM